MSDAARTFTAHRWHPEADYLLSWDIREWDASEDRSLRRYWARGLTASVIAVKLGRSKNSVIGRARRLELAPRPSPLNHGGKADPYPDKAHTPPPQTSRAAKPWPPRQQASAPPHPPAAPSRPLEQLPPAARPHKANTPPAAFPTFRTCQYPRGERPHWDWCGQPTIAGGPYCADCRRICWVVPPRVRALEAAA